MDQFTSQGLPPALQAVFSGRQNAQATRLNDLLQQAQGQQNDIRGLEVLRSQAMSDPNAVNQFKLAQLAGFQGQQDDAALKRGTLESTMGATNAKNQATIGEKDNEMILQSLEGFLDAAAANQNNPVMALEAVRDPRMKQYLGQVLQNTGPEGALKAAAGAREKIIARMADNPAQRGIMEKQRAGDEAAMARQKYSSDAMIRAAQIRADQAAKKQGAQGLIEAVKTGKVSAEKAAVAARTSELTETDPETKALYGQLAMEFEELAKQLKSVPKPGAPDVSAITGMPPAAQPSAFGGRPAPQPPAPQGAPQLPPGWTMK